MDKYEYKVRADEIKQLIAEGDYQQAAEIADTIDWRRVKSIMMLCTISDLYKINRRYEDAKNMLLLAYERRPGGKTICYSLCELCIKTEEFVQAVNYYKEFVQVAPKDSGRYILQYKLYEAQDVSLEERIGVLEELKKRDYREKWAYELAYLYHRVGLATRCVEECDELILWFGEGKYVIKAMELKMLHQPLSASQQEKYDHRFDPIQTPVTEMPEESIEAAEEAGVLWDEQGRAAEEQPGWEMPMENIGEQFYAEGVSSVGGMQAGDMSSAAEGVPVVQPEPDISVQESAAGVYAGWPSQSPEVSMDTRTDWVLSTPKPEVRENILSPAAQQPVPEELDIQVKTMDVGAYNTINLQAEIAAGLQEVLAEDKVQTDAITRSIIAPMLESDTESLDFPETDQEDGNDLEPQGEIMESSEVFFGETGELGAIQKDDRSVNVMPEDVERALEASAGEALVTEESVIEKPAAAESAVESADAEKTHSDDTAKIVMDQLRREMLQKAEQVLTAQPPRELAGVLSQESDGQISLVVPESETVEKQITGQMNFEEILGEWEKLKQENEAKRQEEVRQHVLQQTGNMFTEFEESLKDGLLEQLENEPVEPEEEELEIEEIGEVRSGEAGFGEAGSEELAAEGNWEAESGEAGPEELAAEENGEAESGEAEPEELAAGGNGEAESGEAEPEELAAEENGEAESGEAGPEELAVEENWEAESGEAGSEELATGGNGEAESGEAGPEKLATGGNGEAESGEEGPEKLASGGNGEAESGEAGSERLMAEDNEEAESGEKGSEESGAASGEKKSEKSEKVSEGKVPGKSEPGKTEESETEKAEHIETKAKSEKPEASAPEQREKAKTRALTREEKELYAPFIQSRSGRENLLMAIDSISMAAYTGNVIITGEKGMDTLSLAKNMVREIQMTDRNFSGTVAKISGQGLNSKNVEETLGRLGSGALIVHEASEMGASTVEALQKVLQKENFGIIVFLVDTKKAMERLLAAYPKLRESFTARMDVEAMSNDSLVAFGRKYAREMEYFIDELGVLALHTRIEERQTLDHVVTVLEVKDIVDEAIRHVNKKTLGHFFDILFARRYDEEDMIILTEKDFV